VLWEVRNVRRVLRKERTDVLFTPYQIGPKVKEIRQVLMLRNMEPFLCCRYSYSPRSRVRNGLLRRASTYALRGADRVIAVSRFAQDLATGALGLNPQCVRTIHHGGNVEVGSEEYAERDRERLQELGVGRKYVLTPGSLLPYRRCEDVIAAFDSCCGETNGEMQLVIAGSGSDRRYGKLIRTRIAASRHRDRMLAVGHVPWETMAALYRQCLLCVIATEIEACPNIALEAMAAGCVIVSSDRQPLPEMFDGASLEYHARDVDGLVEKMRATMVDGDLRSDLKARAWKRAREFSWEKCAKKTYDALIQW
jgi:glycosyltransferase involved in cell wall biosynthesis